VKQLSHKPLESSGAHAGSEAEPLLHALASANERVFSTIAHQFVRRWTKAFGGDTTIETDDGLHLQFRTLFHQLYLRGFEEPTCLLFSDLGTAQIIPVIDSIRRSQGGAPILLACLTDAQEEIVSCLAPMNRVIAITRELLSMVLCGSPLRNRETLRQLIRTHVPLRRLHPYQTARPVFGDIFFGRTRESELLLEDENGWFLITGPSKIGKSSLLHQYRWKLRRDRSPRLLSSFYINLQPCAGRPVDEVARLFAMGFRDVPYTHEDLKFSELRSFLFSVVAPPRGPIEIIIDEADAVCHMDLLITVAEFAASSGSRLIVAGRSAVRRFWRRHSSTAFGRLRDLRFMALTPEDAWNLFAKPIEALGLRVEDEAVVREYVVRQTSRMPHLVQGCARSVIELAAELNTCVITPSMLHRGSDSFFDFGLLRSHLADLETDQARLAAVEILKGVRAGLYTAERVQAALRRHGVTLSISETTDICDDLVGNCLLTWENRNYGPPRWDICETAQHHSPYLESLRRECLDRLRIRL
jgi:hypothetical protein